MHILVFKASHIEMEPETNQPLTRRDVIKVLMRTSHENELRFQGVNMAGADLSRLDLRHINFKVFLCIMEQVFCIILFIFIHIFLAYSMPICVVVIYKVPILVIAVWRDLTFHIQIWKVLNYIQ